MRSNLIQLIWSRVFNSDGAGGSTSPQGDVLPGTARPAAGARRRCRASQRWRHRRADVQRRSA